jgi:hypothetical protein
MDVPFSSKRHRGWRHDKAKADLSSAKYPNANEHSALATMLLNLWASGHLSATAMQKIALAAMLDGAAHAEIANLAKCGHWGQAPGNIARDVHTTFLPDIKLAPMVSVSVPCIDPKTSLLNQSDAFFFLPHLQLAALMEHYEQEACIMFAVGKQIEFWNGVVAVDCPKLVGHPMVAIESWQQSFLPLFIHGDGVEFSENDSLMTYSWGALLSAGSSQDTSLLLATWPKSCTYAGNTMQEGTWWPILQWIQWSFKALFEGMHPTLDPAGQPFAANSFFAHLAGRRLCSNGMRCVVWSLEGDQDYFCNVLKLPHWSSSHPCWSCNTCPADPETTWKSMLPGQRGWTCKDAAMAKDTLISPHPFFQIPGVTTLMVSQDEMHILFCKGILSRLLGSVLHIWCWPTKGRQANKPADTLASVFSSVQELYRNLGTPTRLTNLKLSMFTNTDKPHSTEAFLKIKGSECKHLLKPIAIIAIRKCSESQLDRRVASCLQSICRLVDILDEVGLFLTKEQHSELVRCLEHFNGHYLWLANWAEEQDRPLFNITIKMHMLHHMVLDAEFLNPRVSWCFKGEDYVGKISHLAGSVSMGVKITNLTCKISQKYRHWQHLRLTRGDYHD